MIKKCTALLISCLLLMLSLCSCSTKDTVYNNTETIELNYNNISNHCELALSTDRMCYLNNYLIQPYFMADKDSKSIIGLNGGYGDGKVQIYGNKIYMMHIYKTSQTDDKYELKCYDVDTKKTEKICEVKNLNNFLILDETLYYLEESGVGTPYYALTLKEYSFGAENHSTVKDNVIAFGVKDNSLHYVIEENGKIAIMCYDAEIEASVKCGEFSVDGFKPETHYLYPTYVSFTSSGVFFKWGNQKDGKTVVTKYSFAENTAENIAFDGYIEYFISFDKNTYFILSDEWYEESAESVLFVLDNATNEYTEIAKFQGNGSLFVGSDNGAYVSIYNDDSVVYYSNDGESQVVCKY